MYVGMVLALLFSLNTWAQDDSSKYCPGFEGVVLKSSGPCPSALPTINDMKPVAAKEVFDDYSRISLDEVNKLLPQYNEATNELVPVNPEVESVGKAISGKEDAQ